MLLLERTQRAAQADSVVFKLAVESSVDKAVTAGKALEFRGIMLIENTQTCTENQPRS